MILRGVFFIALGLLVASPTFGDMVTPNRTIRANTLITTADLQVSDQIVPGAVTDPLEIAGMEARRILYVGRPIRPGDVGPPALVERNQVVTLFFRSGTLLIATEGRALERGGIGDSLRVLNLSSRNTVFGTVDPAGAVRVAQ